MKLWFHSAPLWKMDKFLDLKDVNENSTHNIYVSFLSEYIEFKKTRFLDDPARIR